MRPRASQRPAGWGGTRREEPDDAEHGGEHGGERSAEHADRGTGSGPGRGGAGSSARLWVSVRFT
jgi:hypothetical protein